MNKKFLLVTATTIVVLGLPAAASVVTFQPETEQAATVIGVAANLDGGFSAYTADAGVHHYDSSGKLIGAERLPFDFLERHGEPWTSGPLLSASSLGVQHHLITEPEPIQGSWWEPSGELVDPEPNCAVTRLDSGLKVTRLWQGNEIRMRARQADAEGGIWIHAYDGRLFRFGPDCRAIAVARVPVYLHAFEADPNSRSALALTSELELIRLTPDGIEWRRMLPEVSDWQGEYPVLSILLTGEAVVSYTSRSPVDGSYSERLVAYSSKGVLLWNKEAEWGRRRLYATVDGFVQVRQYGFTAFSRHGEQLSEYVHPEFDDMWASGVNVSGSHVWARFATFHVETDSHLVVFNVTTGVTESWNLDFGQSASVAGLANGRAVVYQWSNTTYGELPEPALRLTTAGSMVEEVPVLSSPLRGGNDVSAADNLGTALIVQDEDSWSVFVTDASMKMRWTRRIPFTEWGPSYRKMQIALGTDRLCVLTEVQRSHESSDNLLILHCFRRVDGRDAHGEIVWPGHSANLAPLIAGSADVVYFGHGDRMPILRYLVDGAGSVSVGHPPFPELSPTFVPFCPCDAFDFDDGSRALLWREADQLLIFPAGGKGGHVTHWLDRSVSQQPIQHFAQGRGRLGILAASDNHFGNEVTVNFFASDGNWQGSIVLDRDLPIRGAIGLLTATDEGWVAVMATPEIMYAWHIPKDVVLQKHHPVSPQSIKRVSTRLRIENAIDPWSPNPWTMRSVLEFDGRHLVLASYQVSVTSVYWLDPMTLEISSSASLPFRPRLLHTLGPKFNRAADGSMYLAGEAPGLRGYEPAIWKLVPELPTTRPDFSLGLLNGAWFDPAISGQGFFLEYIEAANVLFGAWFTFSTEDSYQPSGIQWYTLDANPMPGETKISGGIYLNRDGRFEQGPVTHAERVGDFSVWPVSQNRLQIAIDFDEHHLLGLQLGHPLERILPVASGDGVLHWFDPTISGQGLLLARPLDTPGPFFAGWFTYDPAFKNEGEYAQHWFVLIDDSPVAAGASSRLSTIYRASGGRLGIRGTSNVERVGVASLTLSACDRIEFHYHFDDSRYADSFLGLQKSRTLRPVTGCP